MTQRLDNTEKYNLAIHSLIVFEPTITGKFIESRLALEGNFTTQRDGHKDVFDFCIPYHSGSDVFSAFCENSLNIEYLSTKTKMKPTKADEDAELIFTEPFHCASANNGISIEVKTTTTDAFKVRQTEGHLIQPQRSTNGEVISYALDINYRHADFYLLIQLNKPNNSTTIDNLFSLIRNVWVVSTYRLENSILLSKDETSVSIEKLNNSHMAREEFRSIPKTPKCLATYLRDLVDREIQEFGTEIAVHKKELDKKKSAATKTRVTKSTLSG
ncbi:hypothetical protein I2702_003399 [Vibrio parahaemolyticus]|nr:hypothetical protein [Vibrio parahaemolyticus]